MFPRPLARHAAFLLVGHGVLAAACGAPGDHTTVKSPPSSRPAATPQETVARTLLDEITHGEWGHPKTLFTPAMAEALPAEKLRDVWMKLEGVVGRYDAVRSAKVEPKGSAALVHLTCAFAHGEKVVRITVNEKREVAGIFYGPSAERLESRTRSFVAKASAGDYAGASAAFGAVMRGALPPEKLEAAWKAVEAQAGRFASVEKVTLKPEGEVSFSLASARFEKASLVVKLVYDERDEIVGLFFLPPEVPWAPPGYADAKAFTESDVHVGSTPALPGTLTMPVGDGAVPVVVLVHGSGPSDRDESVGGVKVFKDLALGLASRGIAVLRYEKRSRQSPSGVVTEKEEVLDAARDAIELLRRTARVDPRRIFVLGHSQGGNLAPRIVKDNPGVAGMVVLAGSTRPFQDLLVDQYGYFATLHPESADLKKKVEQARQFKRRVEDPALKPGDDPQPPTGGGMTGAYFLFQRGYDPAATARALAVPIFVLQGERDYQVTGKDLDGWKKELAGAPYATIKAYASLNHLFVRGSGPPSPEEYSQPGHVEEEVVADIATWIAKTPRR